MIKNISGVIEKVIPQYIQSEYPRFVKLIKYTLESTEREYGPIRVIQMLPNIIDVSTVPEPLLDRYLYQYLNSFGKSVSYVDVRTLIKESKNFSMTKGTEKSIDFLFALMGEKVTISYPSEKMFFLNKSLLSGPHRLQDNRYFTRFTYQLDCPNLTPDDYGDIILRTTHPVGTMAFFVWRRSRPLLDWNLPQQCAQINIVFPEPILYGQWQQLLKDFEYWYLHELKEYDLEAAKRGEMINLQKCPFRIDNLDEMKENILEDIDNGKLINTQGQSCQTQIEI